VFLGQTPQRVGNAWGVCPNEWPVKDAAVFHQKWGGVRMYLPFYQVYTGNKEKENTMYTILMLFVVRVILPVGALLLIGGWLRRKQGGIS
jgi:hypothetical protein